MKILVSDSLSDEGLKILKSEKAFQVDVKTGLKPDALKEIIKDYDAIIVRSSTKVTKDIVEAGKNLKVIGRAGVGLDNVDLETASRRGIIVMNTPAGNTISTTEHTMCMILALSRNIPQAQASLKKGEWERSKFTGVEVYGKTLGIIGLGKIGSEVAKRALSFGMKIMAYDPFLSEETAKSLGVESVELKNLLKNSDYVSVHTPLTDETRHMISDKEFAIMKKGVRLINCARGGIIDEQALARAIEAGKIGGCALDVFEKEPPADSALLKCDNVVCTPHLGASTEEAQVNVAIEIAENVRDALLGRIVRNAANFPSVEPEVYKTLEPYINLCEKIGMFASQISKGKILAININYIGEIIKHNTAPLTMGLVKGVLSPIVQETVNFVNATSLAKERGIKVQEAKSSSEEEFVNLIRVEIKTDTETHRISGTLFTNNEPRIVKIDDFYVEAIPVGIMMILSNWDRAGVIGSLGTLLGKHKINIAGMNFGREKLGGKAITVLNVDSEVTPSVLQQIKKTPNILDVKLIRL